MQLTISVLFYFLKEEKKRREGILCCKANYFFSFFFHVQADKHLSLSFYLYFRRWRDCRRAINQVEVMTV
jgi:hypothetical protein